ncbi:MAG: tRNA (adenosine(37)-N6)-threonylcarbamoyltransferase complex dimerization subunit type 1 TsaB [Dehalococcoidia bacterium]
MELSLDTASDMASVALSRQGRLLAELTWRCERNHSTELMPAADGLLRRLSAGKEDLTAVFVCIGPGGYAGLRVGVSTAKGLAFALEVPLVGVGRLELDACVHAAYPGPVCPVHRAGRGELAWAVYHGPTEDWREMVPPRLSRPDVLLSEVPKGALFCGEIDDELAGALAARGARVASVALSVRRAGYLAELGWRRLQAGRRDDPRTLVPLYLREPAIGPRKP